MMMEVFSTSFSSGLDKMRGAVNLSLEFINYNNPYVSVDNLMDLRLIFSELLANAIIHGNGCDESKKVYMVIKVTENGIISKIMDEGKGFRHSEIVKQKSTIADFLSESGRGLKLVSALTDELTFVGKGNTVKFYKELPYRVYSEEDYVSTGISKIYKHANLCAIR